MFVFDCMYKDVKILFFSRKSIIVCLNRFTSIIISWLLKWWASVCPIIHNYGYDKRMLTTVLSVRN